MAQGKPETLGIHKVESSKIESSTVCGLQMCEFCFPKTFTELKVSLGVVPTRTDRVESATRCRPETDVPGTLNFGVPGTYHNLSQKGAK